MRIHLIGIGGTGMGALAGLLCEAGHEVRGSDGPLYPPMSTQLAELGVPLFEGHRAENLDWGPDRVVVGNICRKDHPEAVAAQQRGLKLTSFPALLSELFLGERHSLVVAGTHGKTTTASLLAHLLRVAGEDPGFLIGGVPRDLGRGYALGRPPYFVVEGDEYDTAFFDKRPKFVHYQPRTVILTSVEFDHADIYPTMADVERAFAMLVERIPAEGRLVVCAEAEVALRLAREARCPVQSYSTRGAADWQAVLTPAGERQELCVRGPGLAGSERYEISLSGEHNAQNALAVIAVGRGLGLSAEVVGRALSSFRGVHRRQEVRGQAAGVTVIDDFAHHPTAIRETLRGLRRLHPGRLWAVFEPRSATSRRNLLQHELALALAEADAVVIGPLHQPEGIPLEERFDPELAATEVRAAGRQAQHLPSTEAALAHLVASCRPGDTVVVMSSGGFGGLIEKLLRALEERGS